MSISYYKNVKAKCKQHVTPKKAWDQAIEVWIFVMDYPIECAYEDHLTKFEVVCAPWGEFAAYVKETWLILHKKRFVKALTDKVMHMGSTTTNR